MKLLSHVRLLATPWTAAYQAPLFMGFSRQEYWSGVPLPSTRPFLELFKDTVHLFAFILFHSGGRVSIVKWASRFLDPMSKLLFSAASRPLICLAPQLPTVSGKLGKWAATIPLGYLFGHSFKKELAWHVYNFSFNIIWRKGTNTSSNIPISLWGNSILRLIPFPCLNSPLFKSASLNWPSHSRTLRYKDKFSDFFFL